MILARYIKKFGISSLKSPLQIYLHPKYHSSHSNESLLRKVISIKKANHERRRNIAAEIEQDLKSAVFLNHSKLINEKTSSYQQIWERSNTFDRVGIHAARLLHQNAEVKELILLEIKNVLNNGTDEDIVKAVRASATNLLRSQDIRLIIVNKLEQLITQNKITLFIDCVFQDYTLLNHFINSTSSPTITPTNLEDGDIIQLNNHTELKEVEEQDGNDKNLLNDFEDYQIRDNTKEDALQFNNKNLIQDSNETVALDDENPQVQLFFNNEPQVVISSRILKQIYIECRGKEEIISNYGWLDSLVDKECDMYSLYLLLKYENNQSNINKLLHKVQQKHSNDVLVKQYANIDILKISLIIQRVANVSQEFATTALSVICNIQRWNIQELLSVIVACREIVESKYYQRDINLEQAILHNIFHSRIFLPNMYDTISFKSVFLDILKLASKLNILAKEQSLLLEMTLTIFAETSSSKILDSTSGQIAENQEQIAQINSGQLSSPSQEEQMESEIMYKCLQVLSKFNVEAANDSRMIFQRMVDKVFNKEYNELKKSSSNMFHLFYSFEIATNLRLNIDKAQAEYLALSVVKEQSSLSYYNFLTKEQQKRYSYGVFSFMKFISRFQLQKCLTAEDAKNLFTYVNQNALLSIYESLLSNSTLNSSESVSKAQLMFDISSSLLLALQFQQDANGSASEREYMIVCVSLRNFLANNNLVMKNIKYSIVDISQYSQKRQEQPKIHNQQQLPELIIPFKLELIKKIPSSQRGLKQFLESQINSQPPQKTNDVNLQYLLNEIKQQLGTRIFATHQPFDIIRNYPEVRKAIQKDNSSLFKLFQQYVHALMKQTQILPTESFSSTEQSQVAAPQESVRKSIVPDLILSYLKQVSTAQIISTRQKEGERVITEILFLSRVLTEKDYNDPPNQLIHEFIRNNINQMDLEGVLFAKQAMNTRQIKDNRLHGMILSRLQQVLSSNASRNMSNVVNFIMSLNLIKAFSLEDFDLKTLFRLEHEVSSKLPFINSTNLSILAKKYYFKSASAPTRLMSALIKLLEQRQEQNEQQVISDNQVWTYMLIKKFYQQFIHSINLSNLKFDSNISTESLLQFIRIISESHIDKYLDQLFTLIPTTKSNTKEGEVAELMDQILNDKREDYSEYEQKYIKNASYLKNNLEQLMRKNQNNRRYEDISLIINNHNTDKQLSLQKMSTYEYLIFTFYLKENREAPINHSKQLLEQLNSEYNQGKITLKQLVVGIYLLQIFQNQNKQQLYHQLNENILKLNSFVIKENKYNNLITSTPSITSILLLHRISQQLPQNDQLNDTLLNQIIYYKFKKNEKQSEIIFLILVLQQLKQQGSQNNLNKDIYFKALDKVETIFQSRMPYWTTQEVLQVFTLYFQSELASFSLFEACDKYLKEETAKQEADKQRMIKFSDNQQSQQQQENSQIGSSRNNNDSSAYIEGSKNKLNNIESSHSLSS